MLSALAVLVPAHGSEGGSHNIPAGAFTFGAAFVPAPGTTSFTGYFLWLRANSLRGNSGSTVPPDFRADYFGHAGRFMHTWGFDWDGFHLTSSTNYLIDYARVKVGPTHDEDADLSAWNVEPIMVTKTFGNLQLMSGANLWYPIGHYDPRGPANAAGHAHYATIIYEFAATWRPLPNLQIDSENYIGFNFRNHRTGYRSGDLFGNELGITAWPFKGLPQLGVGAGGYYLHQFQDDHEDGALVPGMKLTQIAFGPQAVYALTPATLLIFKWQHDFRSDNAANGDLFWMEFAVPLD